MSTTAKLISEDVCSYCRRTFPLGTRGLRSHLKQSIACGAAHRVVLEQRREAANQMESRGREHEGLSQEHDPHEMDAMMPESPIGLDEFIQGSSSGQRRGIESLGEVESGNQEKRRRTHPDTDEDPTFIQKYPNPPQTYGQKRTRWERMRDERLQGRQGRWGGFASEEEWELARWLMKSGVSQTELDKYLKLPITRNRMKLSFKNKRKFLELVDGLPTSNIPGFECEVISVEGTLLDAENNRRTEVVEVWKRDPVECVREILSNPALDSALKYEPQKIFSNASCDSQFYNEAWTGEWWWDAQHELPPGSTIAPVILMSDKTQLSQFGGDKQAYPVYLTLGNVAKAVRRQGTKRATVLLGYLPVTKLECFTKKERKMQLYHLFHYAMSKILAPLVDAGRNGVRMTCADGQIRHVHPILFSYVGDYPEQCLVTCCLQNRCPRCPVHPDHRGENAGMPGVSTEPRQPQDVKQDLRNHQKGRPTPRLTTDGMHPIYAPFWADLPYCNIFSCITPDLLHQIHKGVFNEHLVDWCCTLASPEEIDSRCRAMPDSVGVRHFQKGISTISQWTGTEAKQLESIFVSLLAGAIEDPQILKAAQSFVDFIYYSSYTSHSTQTLEYMQSCLDEFHANKEAFIRHEVRTNFNFPKFHTPQHYVSAIITHGSLDGYNTELPERLHIDLAKAGYRASNKRDYFTQMVTWLRRQESVDAFTLYLEWVMPEYKAADLDSPEDDDAGPEPEDEPEEVIPAQHAPTTGVAPDRDSSTPGPPIPPPLHKIAKHCPLPKTPVSVLQDKYGAVDFLPALTEFLHKYVKSARIRPTDVDRFDVFKRFTMHHAPLNGFDTTPISDTVRATPAYPAPRPGKPSISAHFDPVLVDIDGNAEAIGMKGITVAQVRVIFKLPSYLVDYPHPLVYLELFTGTHVLAAHVRMYQVRRSTRNQRRKAIVIPLSRIRSSCYLSPKFGRSVPPTWTSENVLEECNEFFVNHYKNNYTFQGLSEPPSTGHGPPRP